MNIENRKQLFVNNIWFYHKSNLVRAPLEALISIYIMEIAIIFSKWFDKEECQNAGQIILMIFIPLLFALIICLLYSGGIVIFINRKIYKLISGFDGNEICFYKKINKEMKCTFRNIHIVGAICYLVAAVIVSFSFVGKVYVGYNFENLSIILVYAFFMGILWNIYGYYSDGRIDWSKIYVALKNVEIKDNICIQKEKYIFYQKSVVWQIIVFFTIIFLLICIFIRFDYDIISNISGKDSLNILITYSAFATWFIAVLKMYCTQIISTFFPHKKSDSEIFPSESKILTGRE